MYKFALSISICLFLISCAHDMDDDGLDCGSTFYSYRLFDNEKIEVDSEDFEDTTILDFEIKSGDSLVGIYSFTPSDCDDASENYTRYICFQFDPDANSFSFSNSELVNAHCYFNSYGLDYDLDVPITEGTITGNKIDDDNWTISIDVHVNQNFADIVDTQIQTTNTFTFY